MNKGRHLAPFIFSQLNSTAGLAPGRYRELPGVLDLIGELGEIAAPFRHLGRSHVHPTI